MRKIFIFFSICGIILLLSCSSCNENNEIIGYDTTKHKSVLSEYLKLAAFGESLSIDEILTNVTALNGKDMSRTKISSVSISDSWNIAVNNGVSRTSTSDSVAIYCVYDKERNTTTLVCGNRLFPFTLAVIDGEFKATDITLGGIRDYFSALPAYLAENKLEYDANEIANLESQIVSSDYSDGVYSFVIQDESGALPLQRLEYETEYSYSSVVGPLMTTNWAQGTPYNKTLSHVPNEDGTVYVLPPAGCVAVAIGQILAYHKAPNTITAGGMTWQGDWDEITQSPMASFLSDEYQTQVADLMKVIGNGVYMQYEWDGSSSNIDNAYNFFKTTIGASANQIESYSYLSISNSLANLRPVYIRGYDSNKKSGHAWVLDGKRAETAKVYERIYRSKVAVPSNPIVNSEWELISSVYQSESTTPQVHCNWGWGNRANGHFDSGVFNVAEFSFNKSIYIICNINPN